jgi:hypothetical protein
LLNYDESAFALNGDLHANADDIVTLRLEDPSGAYQDDLDTGEEPGVDVIPYYFGETMERRVCWENDPGADPVPSDAAPAFMELRNEADEPVLHVEQDGGCVTQLVTAGRYRAVFHHGASARADRDLLFILPQDRDDEASVRRPGVIGESSFEPAPEDLDALAAPVPFCAFGSEPSIGVVARVANPRRAAPDAAPCDRFRSSCSPSTAPAQTCRCSSAGARIPRSRPSSSRRWRTVTHACTRTCSSVVRARRLPGVFPPCRVSRTRFSSRDRPRCSPSRARPRTIGIILIRTNGCDQCNLMGVDLHGAD